MSNSESIDRLFDNNIVLYSESELYDQVEEEWKEYLIKIVKKNKDGLLATEEDLEEIDKKTDLDHRYIVPYLKNFGLVAVIHWKDLERLYYRNKTHVSPGLKEAFSSGGINYKAGKGKKYYVAMVKMEDGSPLYKNILNKDTTKAYHSHEINELA
jgi:hypothetical protein